MSIQILSDVVVAQIAAGEVIERPASVVKELLENSLDAGAQNIRIEITGGGRQRIRISDDGVGIPSDEIEVAFRRHATSKLRTIEDLNSMLTLGFRGEALASIASVSQVTMVSRHRSEENGVVIQLAGSEALRRQTVGAPSGTVITVENLFYNTPARLKFLKKEATEKRQIALYVTRYAMAYPHVRFVLEQDGREVFRTSGSGNLADVLVATLGLESFRSMVEVDATLALRSSANIQMSVSGYTSVPRLHRADRNHITLFVNGRWIQDTRLSYAVVQAYHTFLMTGRYPIAVLMMHLPPHLVDVNVHPVKAEVRFAAPDDVFAVIQRAVRRSVVDLATVPAMRGPRLSDLSTGAAGAWPSPGLAQMPFEVEIATPGQRARMPLPAGQGKEVENDPTAIPVGPEAPSRPRTLPILRVIGQIGATYIVAEGPSGLYVIDQHAAHERILYEQVMEAYHHEKQLAQLRLDAQTIHLSAPDARLIEEHLSSLERLGFTLEPFGPSTFIVRSIPALLTDIPIEELIHGLVAELEAGHAPGQEAVEARIVRRICKRVAIKAGQILSTDEMQALIRQLERCQSPHTCPHGRPTMLHMTSEQLAREFGRLGA